MVYDVTKFFNDHPGGPQVILEHAGKDASETFEAANHPDSAKRDMK
jgi:cytochrome b involved in lipid metabolism